MRLLLLGYTILLLASQISALGDTDTITWGGDNTRCGYQSNHNMDPNIVMGPEFGQIFKTKLPGNFNGLAAEQIFASPLVYTGSDGIQYIYIATTQNNLYKLDAKTGAIVQWRNLHVPFLQVELESCVDINPVIGITATGVIDPESGIWYVTAKTYSDKFQDGNFSPQNPPGRLNGRYWQHAIRTEDLSEVPDWPVLVDGTIFRNNPNRMFIGGNQHSRPGALLVGDYLYTGYASHCVQYNYTGAIIGFNKKTGKIIEAFATEGGPEPNTIKGGGVWMSGGGMAYDGRGSMYFSTGNGYASQLKAIGNSVPGRNPPTALEEAAINAKINDDGTLTIIDFFMPWEKTGLDGADKDLGTTPLEILPSDVFSCPHNRRIGIVTGKSGKTYWLDLDNLGGYQMGPNDQDAVIQVFQNENSVYAGAGVLPLSGGYIYISVTQYPTHVFKFSCNNAGNAVFTKVTDTADKNAYILGTGHGTTTSLDGQEGTGLLWVSDVQDQGLRIYDPIPPSNGGPLDLLNAFNVPGVTKFSRPVFGNGRVYISTSQGYLYGFGSPVNAPLNCSSPYSFGSLDISTVSSPVTITCIALTDTRVNSIRLNSTNFNISNVPSPPFGLSSGKTFNFTAVCDPSTVGSLSDDIIINVTNTQAGFSSRAFITLKATVHSAKPILAIAPNSIAVSTIAGQPGPMQSSLFWNMGDNILSINNVSFSFVSEQGPYVQPNTTKEGFLQVGPFLFVEVPKSIQPGNSEPISVIYQPTAPGNNTVHIKTFSDGGTAALNIFGIAGTNPKCVIEFQTPDRSGWIPYSNSTPFSFGTVYEAQTRNLLLRITNGGGPNAVPLSITVSKPPYGLPGIIGKSNNIDLAEGTSIAAGQSQTANLYCSVPKAQVNTRGYNETTQWVLNTGDPDLGKQQIQFLCNAIAEQVGPLLPNGTAQYGYVGCFKENNPGRQLAQNVYSNTKNTNDRCISACYALNYTFAGTQYSQECWCGNAIPIQLDKERDCNFGCAGNGSQTCGGDGYLHDSAHISLFADSKKFDGNTTSPPLSIPPSSGQYNFIGCYAERGGKTLSDKSTTSDTMTVQICATFCSAYPYFGLEFSAECYCGSKLNTQSTITSSSQCNMPCKGSNSQYCGAGSRMQVYQLNSTGPSSTASTETSTTATSSPTASLAGWVPLGCYNETTDRRALQDKQVQGLTSNSLESCAVFCAGYSFFGVEYASECYCDNVLYLKSIKQPNSSGCNMACAGNSSETCGGPNFLNVYSYQPNVPSTTSTMIASSSSTPISSMISPNSSISFSISSSTTERSSSLSLGPTSHESLRPTPTGAISCPSWNSTLFKSSTGSVFRIECYTDRTANDLNFLYATTMEQCLMLCEITPRCRDVSWRISPGGATPCYMKTAAASTFTIDQGILGAVWISGSGMPNASSTSVVMSNSQFSSLASSSVLLPPSTLTSRSAVSSFSSMTPTFVSSLTIPLSSDTSSTISSTLLSTGAIPSFSHTTLPVTGSPVSSAPSSTASTSRPSSAPSSNATTSPSTSNSTSAPSISIPSLPTIGSYHYAGCWSDPASSGQGRALTGMPVLINSASMTPQFCAAYCTQFANFGVEFGRECWCGPFLSVNSSLVLNQSDCSFPCGGNTSQTCGGSSRLSLYKSIDPRKVSTTPVVPGPLMGNYTYASCYVDTVTQRLLSILLDSDGMSTEACLAAAELNQYKYAGLEYGRECWLGNVLTGNSTSGGNIKVPESDCNTSCDGARGEICGGANRMNLWVRNLGV